MKGLYTYIRDSFRELSSNVTWPTWKELQSHTWLVIFASILFAGVIFAYDWVANQGLGTLFY